MDTLIYDFIEGDDLDPGSFESFDLRTLRIAQTYIDHEIQNLSVEVDYVVEALVIRAQCFFWSQFILNIILLVLCISMMLSITLMSRSLPAPRVEEPVESAEPIKATPV